MKKLLAAIACVVLALGLAGCPKKAPAPAKKQAVKTAPKKGTTKPSNAKAAAPKKADDKKAAAPKKADKKADK